MLLQNKCISRLHTYNQTPFPHTPYPCSLLAPVMLRPVHHSQPTVLKHHVPVRSHVPRCPHQRAPFKRRGVHHFPPFHRRVAANVAPRHTENLVVLHRRTGTTGHFGTPVLGRPPTTVSFDVVAETGTVGAFGRRRIVVPGPSAVVLPDFAPIVVVQIRIDATLVHVGFAVQPRVPTLGDVAVGTGRATVVHSFKHRVPTRCPRLPGGNAHAAGHVRQHGRPARATAVPVRHERKRVNDWRRRGRTPLNVVVRFVGGGGATVPHMGGPIQKQIGGHQHFKGFLGGRGSLHQLKKLGEKQIIKNNNIINKKKLISNYNDLKVKTTVEQSKLLNDINDDEYLGSVDKYDLINRYQSLNNVLNEKYKDLCESYEEPQNNYVMVHKGN